MSDLMDDCRALLSSELEAKDAEIEDANYCAEFNKKRCEELETEIERLKAVVDAAGFLTFSTVPEDYAPGDPCDAYYNLEAELAKLEEST